LKRDDDLQSVVDMVPVGREGIEPPQPKAADLQSAELTTCSICPSVVCVVTEV
jgi:hypothetical protein